MKANIHPEYKDITVTCSCGHKFVTGSALGKDLTVEVCNECHPFYTGKQKIVDTAGRVERFKGKFGGFSLKGRQEGEQTEEAAPAKPTQAQSQPKAQAQAQPKPQAQPKAPQAKEPKGADKSAKSSGKSAGKSDGKKSK